MMRRQITTYVAVVLLCTAASVKGAGSDVADAVMKGDTATVRKLLLQKADVNAKQVDGATALHWAVYRDDVVMAERLLKAGADAKERGPNGETTVMFAARNGNPAAIKLLVAAGGDVNAKEALR